MNKTFYWRIQSSGWFDRVPKAFTLRGVRPFCYRRRRVRWHACGIWSDQIWWAIYNLNQSNWWIFTSKLDRIPQNNVSLDWINQKFCDGLGSCFQRGSLAIWRGSIRPWPDVLYWPMNGMSNGSLIRDLLPMLVPGHFEVKKGMNVYLHIVWWYISTDRLQEFNYLCLVRLQRQNIFCPG